MNLRQFLEYKTHCPICKTQLVTSFHSIKKQVVRYEDDRLLVLFRLDALGKKQIDYKVGYSFGLDDHSWYVEFYTRDSVRFEKDSPDFLRERFKELNKNLGSYIFHRHCAKCYCYNYSTKSFDLSFKTGKIPEIEICLEYFGLGQHINDGYKIYKLLNDYEGNKSTLIYLRTNDPFWARSDCGATPSNMNMIQLSLIKFASKEETILRINKLLVFS